MRKKSTKKNWRGEENKLKENNKIIEAKKKVEKIVKKIALEQKWELLRWVTRYIKENKWEELKILRDKHLEEEEKRNCRK